MKDNKYIWSLDISTTNIGIALWDSHGNLVELKHLELKTDKTISINDRDIYKANVFKNYCLEYKKRVYDDLNGTISMIIVEEPLGGSINPSTASLLFGFNAVCRYILYEIFSIIALKISVYDSRKHFLVNLVNTEKRKGELIEVLSFPKEYINDKKLYIWERVRQLEPQIEWFYKKDGKPKDINYDMSDSFVVGIAGLITQGIISKEDWKKKYMTTCFNENS